MPKAVPALRYRRQPAIAVAAVIAMIGALPLVGYGWIFAPVLVGAAAVALWAWRSGTDVDATGLRVRAALGTRHLRWADIAELGADARGRAAVRLTSGAVLALPGVTPADLPNLVAASGQELFVDPT